MSHIHLLRNPRRSVRRQARSLQLEWLEPRALLSIITVTSTDDTIATDGVVTLREAITASNTNAPSGDAPAGSPGLDTIEFKILGPGPHVISLDTDLPVITEPIVIDGYTQPGSSANSNPIDQPDNAVLQIELDGSNSLLVGEGLAVFTGGGGSTIKGLIITGVNGRAIDLSSSAPGNHIVGNFIGVDPTGSTSVGSYSGVEVYGSNNVIGGTSPADRNLIGSSGVLVQGAAATYTVVEGNFIGLKADGSSALNGGGSPISVRLAQSTTIGGYTTDMRNVIGGRIAVTASSSTTIQGNYLGVDRTGTAAVNVLIGTHEIDLEGDNQTTIVGNILGCSMATPDAVYVDQCQATKFGGNFIGADPTGTHNIGHFQNGLTIRRSTYTSVGSSIATEGNVIANNISGGKGCSISLPPVGSDPTNDVVIEGNSLYGNDGPAITGSSIEAPVLTSATATTISGNLTGIPGAAYRIEYFATPNTGGASNQQARTFLGFQNLIADPISGKATLSFSPTDIVPAGDYITATATRNGTATSNLSNAVTVSATGCDLGVSVQAAPEPVAQGGDLTFTFNLTNLGPDPAQSAKLTTSVPTGTTFVSFTTPGSWNVGKPTPAGTGTVSADIASLAVGNTLFTLVVHVNPTATPGSKINLSSSVSSTTPDGNAGNNTATASTTVAAAPATTVQQFRTTPSRGAITSIILTFSDALDSTRAQNLKNYTLLTAGADRKLGTRDDGKVVLKKPVYDAKAHTVTLIPASRLANNVPCQLTALATSQASGLIDMQNKLIDGNSDGIPGGNYVCRFGPPPVVLSLKTTATRTTFTAITLTFSEPLDATRAQKLSNYYLTTAGLDGQWGTGDDQVIQLKKAVYTSSGKRVTLTPASALPKTWAYQLKVTGTSAARGLIDVNGNLLDGNKDGVAGDNYVSWFGK